MENSKKAFLTKPKAKVSAKVLAKNTKDTSFTFPHKISKKDTQNTMDESGDGEEELTPFWLQNTTNIRHTERLRRRATSIFFSSGVVIFLLLVLAVLFLVFVLPSTLSFSAQIFRPNSVKKSWDSLNIVLVLVAVVFGFISKIKNDDKDDEFQSSPIKQNEEANKPKSSNADQWYNFNTIETQKPSTSYSNPDQWYQQLDTKDPFLRRNSSSYPDLREFSSNRYDYGDYSRIFNDDVNLDSNRVSNPTNHQHHRRHHSVSEIESFETIPKKTKTIIIDTLVTPSENATVSTPPPSTIAPPPENQEKRQVLRRKERLITKGKKEPEPISPFTELKPPLPPSPETQPSPPVPVANLPESQEMPYFDYQNVRRNKTRLNRVVHTPPPPPPPTPPPENLSNKKSATKDFLNSIYHKKKKKLRQKSVENLDSLIHQSQQPITAHFTPPPPPPPPPTAFQNLFLTKKQKRKRTISVTFPPPPPPTPPPAKPPTTEKIKPLDRFEENNSGGESPLSRIPPPPPLPPPAYFKNPAWKFVVQGDYVRVNSSNSSRSGSPDIDDVESDVTPSSDDGGLLTPFHPSAAFCQSPDVNSKAESFITSFRAKLKLEKAHSMNGRHLGLSGLGRGSGPRRI